MVCIRLCQLVKYYYFEWQLDFWNKYDSSIFLLFFIISSLSNMHIAYFWASNMLLCRAGYDFSYEINIIELFLDFANFSSCFFK